MSSQVSQATFRALSSLACGARGVASACGASTLVAPPAYTAPTCVHACRLYSWTANADTRDAVGSSGTSTAWTGSRLLAAFSTASARASTAVASSSAPQPERQLLQPAVSIPTEMRAKLADELDAAASRGRRARPPTPAESEKDSAGASALAGLNDAEVQEVFDKLVGGLTKSGRKTLARRIVLDAFRVMRQHLRKGNLEELK